MMKFGEFNIMAIDTSIEELKSLINNLQRDIVGLPDTQSVLIPIINKTGFADDWKFNISSEKMKHPEYIDCEDDECLICGERDCPYHEPLHYHHDGCPLCIAEEEKKRAERK